MSLDARQRAMVISALWLMAAYVAGRHDGYRLALSELQRSHLAGFMDGARSR